MTDKQIINEIDISKCEFCYSGKYCHIYSGTADSRWLCEENEDCQIKKLLLQLKRKEQELQEAIDNYVKLDNQRVKEYNVLVAKYNNKEQECEELKKLYEEVCSENLKEIYELIKKNDLWREIVNVVNGKLEKQVDQLKRENEQLKTKVFRFESKQTSMGEQNKKLIEDNINLSNENAKIKAENKELIAKYNDCYYVTTNYQVCFEGALGAIKELAKSKKTKEQVEHYTNVALNYLSMRYDERRKVPNKYKQTLQEIKRMMRFANEILQKINECEVE